MAAGRRRRAGGAASTMRGELPTGNRRGRNPEGQRADQRVVRSDGRLHRARRAAVQPLRRLGVSGRVLFLLRHAVDDRVRRLRAGYQPRRVRVAGEDGPLRAVPGVRAGAVGDVLRPHAGGDEE